MTKGHSSRASSSRREAVAAEHAPSTPPAAHWPVAFLVLNRLYMAVHVVNVRRAFGLLCRELAESSISKRENSPPTRSNRGAR